MKFISLFLVLYFLTACPGIVPGSRPYSPTSGTYEADIWAKASRDIFPDDIRKSPANFKDQIFAWTGIITAINQDGNLVTSDYEHHYWDWIMDYGIQNEKAFLSPRGEGKFRCYQKFHRPPGPQDEMPQKNDMALIYATILSVEPDGLIRLDCAPWFRFLNPGEYSTDIWDYGRDYLLKRDKKDFRVLRVP